MWTAAPLARRYEREIPERARVTRGGAAGEQIAHRPCRRWKPPEEGIDMDTFNRSKHVTKTWSRSLLAVAPLLVGVACNDAGPAPADEEVEQVRSAIVDPVAVCNQDPRVNSGLVPLAVCAGARVFFDETFNGN